MTQPEPLPEREITPYTPPKPATPEQMRAELRLFRRKAVKRLIGRYLRILAHIGNPSSWEFLDDLAVVGYLRQHTPISQSRKDSDDDIIFYIDFQYALWGFAPRLRVTFALRYIWDMTDTEIARFLRCARRTVLRLAERLTDSLYESLHDYVAAEEQELRDILLCKF